MRTNPAYIEPEPDGYEPNNPKHPRWVDDLTDRADQHRDQT